jgi:hypothetical protein
MWRALAGIPLPPVQRGYERDVAAARTAGRGELRGGLGGGRKLTLTQAVAYALEQADGDAEKPV